MTDNRGSRGLTRGPALTEDLPTLILGEEGAAVEYVCTGPDADGRCPREGERGQAWCANQWVISQGWSFKVAPGARACPLISLGLAGRYPRAPLSGGKEEVSG
jgi:hypothetical protein